jgi:hypothetical protein
VLVADVASRLFGTKVQRETLRRATDETLTVEHVGAQLGAVIDAGVRPGLSNVDLTTHPLAVWVEGRLGLMPWTMATPRFVPSLAN